MRIDFTAPHRQTTPARCRGYSPRKSTARQGWRPCICVRKRRARLCSCRLSSGPQQDGLEGMCAPSTTIAFRADSISRQQTPTMYALCNKKAACYICFASSVALSQTGNRMPRVYATPLVSTATPTPAATQAAERGDRLRTNTYMAAPAAAVDSQISE